MRQKRGTPRSCGLSNVSAKVGPQDPRDSADLGGILSLAPDYHMGVALQQEYLYSTLGNGTPEVQQEFQQRFPLSNVFG